jgi:phospholipid/cholesterol/gamma-HCH transport system substrate-binding protein
MRRLVGLLGAVAVLLSACTFSAQDLPLPGGVGSGDKVFHVTAEFKDVLDLVPRSSVKVDDVSVGEVEKIWLDGYTAKVQMRVRNGVTLPDNATAQIRQTSLLGEKFVSLARPAEGTQTYGRLGNGDVIPLARTGRNVEVEEVLSALSLLLNGGGVAQLKTITTELNKALSGREADVKELLKQLDLLLSQLDDNKREITRAIDNLDRLAASLAKQRDTIATTVDELPAALTILADQREQLTKLLTELSKLGEVGTRVIESTKEDLLANLESLEPILTELARSGDALPKSLEVLFTYPFADSAANAVRGDYTNLQLTLDLDLQTLLSGEGPIQLPTDGPVPTKVPVPTELPRPTDLETPLIPLPTICLPPIINCPEGVAPSPSAETDSSSEDEDDLTDLLLGGL